MRQLWVSGVCVITLALAVAASLWATALGTSTDLLAAWLAASHFPAGPIYPGPEPLFTMTAPDAWYTEAPRHGHDGALFPYLYPPLWAAVLHPLTDLLAFEQVASAMRALNHAAVPAMAWLAWRAAGRPGDGLVWVTVATLAILATPVGHAALAEGQAQVLVSLLLILAIERDRAGAAGWAGAALALAAAIKVYPALFALVWLAAGRWRALTSFAVVGGALAATSVALAGWPLHEAFLDGLRSIAGTTLRAALSLSLDPMLQTFGLGPEPQLVPMPGLENAETLRIGWMVAEKTWAQATLAKLAVVAALLAIGYAQRAAPPVQAYGALWPLAIVVTALLGPISWSYSYMPAFAFLPALLPLLGRSGPRALILILLPLVLPVWELWTAVPIPGGGKQLVGTLVMLALGGLFLSAARSPNLGRVSKTSVAA